MKRDIPIAVCPCGANLIYEAAGMYGSLLGASLESFVLDNDMIGAIMRARGFEVSETTLSLEVIRMRIGGAGHFSVMQKPEPDGK